VLSIAEASVWHEVGEGHWILLRAGMRHRGTRDLDDHTWFRWICFTCEPGTVDRGPTPTGAVHDRREVDALFGRFLADRDVDRLTQQAADAYTTLILHRLAPPNSGSMSNDERLRHLVARHVDSHLDDPDLTTATIAAALGYHPDHLGRAFRNDATVPITTYIHQERVDRPADCCAPPRSRSTASPPPAGSARSATLDGLPPPRRCLALGVPQRPPVTNVPHGSARSSALDAACGESLDQPALGDEEEQDDRQGDDDRARHQDGAWDLLVVELLQSQ